MSVNISSALLVKACSPWFQWYPHGQTGGVSVQLLRECQCCGRGHWLGFLQGRVWRLAHQARTEQRAGRIGAPSDRERHLDQCARASPSTQGTPRDRQSVTHIAFQRDSHVWHSASSQCQQIQQQGTVCCRHGQWQVAWAIKMVKGGGVTTVSYLMTVDLLVPWVLWKGEVKGWKLSELEYLDFLA